DQGSQIILLSLRMPKKHSYTLPQGIQASKSSSGDEPEADRTKLESGTAEYLTLKIHLKFISFNILINYISLKISLSQQSNTTNDISIRGPWAELQLSEQTLRETV